LSTGIEIIPSS